MINPAIQGILEQYSIPLNDGIAYLLAVHYECIPSYVPPLLIQRVNLTNILGFANNDVVWNTPLFINEEEPLGKWEWVVTEYMEIFNALNPKRKGTKSSCISRMKAFFAQNPEVRKEDIIGATRMYAQNVTNPEYLITSHYFIFKDKGISKTSPLEEWLDKYNLYASTLPKETTTGDLSNTMQ